MRGRGHSFARVDGRAAGQMEVADFHVRGHAWREPTLAHEPTFCTGSIFTTGSVRGRSGDGAGAATARRARRPARLARARCEPPGADAGATTTGACSTTTLRRARRNAAAKPANRSTKQIATNSMKNASCRPPCTMHEFGSRAAGQQQHQKMLDDRPAVARRLDHLEHQHQQREQQERVARRSAPFDARTCSGTVRASRAQSKPGVRNAIML